MHHKESRPGLIRIGLAVLLVAIPAIWIYFVATSAPVHPNAATVPSTVDTPPAGRWDASVLKARQIARSSLAERNLPGLSVAVGIGSDIVWAEGFGYADLDKRAPLTPKHKFRIGTASTVLTSAAAGLLLEEGKLDLDRDIQTWVPEFPRKQWPVTLRQVMAHTAGISSDSADEGPLFSQSCQHPKDALRFFADDPLRFQPGTAFRFSRYGWILVSAAIEAATRTPFPEYMQSQVFRPLGMRDTVPDAGPAPAPDVVRFYFPRLAADPTWGIDRMRDLRYSCYAGSSVFLSTPSDLVRFGTAINGGRLLKRSTVQLLQTTQRLPSGEETGYGLGWDRENVTLGGKSTTEVGHNGDSLGGMVSSLVTFPEQGIVVSVMSNISYSDTYSVAVRIAQEFAQERK